MYRALLVLALVAGLGGLLATQTTMLSFATSNTDIDTTYTTGDNQYRNGYVIHTTSLTAATAWTSSNADRISFTVAGDAVDGAPSAVCTAALNGRTGTTCDSHFGALAQYLIASVDYRLTNEGVATAATIDDVARIAGTDERLAYVLPVANPHPLDVGSGDLWEIDSGYIRIKFDVDADQDGVYTTADACPETAAETVDGCPAGNTGTDSSSGTTMTTPTSTRQPGLLTQLQTAITSLLHSLRQFVT